MIITTCIVLIFLSTLSLRRATAGGHQKQDGVFSISIHALLAESDPRYRKRTFAQSISIHALLAESDTGTTSIKMRRWISIHALLAESDRSAGPWQAACRDFYPRSPCGERPQALSVTGSESQFLSTLSLRRATFRGDHGHISGDISIHALLAESDLFLRSGPMMRPYFYPRSPCGERPP